MLKIGIILIVLMIGFSGMAPGGERVTFRATEKEVSRAQRRNEQLPVSHEEAMVLAWKARSVGARDEAETFYERAMENAKFGEVARVELAELVVDVDTARGVDLVLPLLESAGSRQLRDAAVEVIRKSAVAGLSPGRVRLIEQASRRLPRASRRIIDAVVADPDTTGGRKVLRKLLERNVGDLPALEAARRIEEEGELSPREKWLVASSLFRHALYEEAAVALERVAGMKSNNVPGSEAAFLRGRCAFRLDRWAEAERWYRRALKATSGATRRAEIQVHIARCQELAGNFEGAVETARQAVITKSSDDRRLFLIRLRLRQGRRDLAAAGLVKVRSSSARARGQVLTALDDLARGRNEEAVATLRTITHRAWRGPAGVVAADELVRAGRPLEAITTLEDVATGLSTFWGDQARRVMASLPPKVVSEWRARREAINGMGEAKNFSDLSRWAVLEFDRDVLEGIRERITDARPISPLEGEPTVKGLAGDLRSLGLNRLAVRWDPESFPVDSHEKGLWTVHQFLKGGSPWRAIRLSHAMWLRWGSDVPVRAYPDVLNDGLYPLPRHDDVVRAAEGGGLDGALVAGVAREESRWNPRVLSRVGARGLMQLMPLTAAAVSAREGRPRPSPDQLFEPEWSLDLGAAELGRLTRGFDGFSAAAVAAYNAGEAQSRLWFEQCGPDCNEARFVLTVTFDATRGYTEEVLASAEVYRGLMAEPSN